MKNNQEGFGLVGVIAIVTILILIGAVGWLVYDRQQENKSSEQTTTQQPKPEQDAPNKQETELKIPEGWVKYLDTENDISFYYPGDWNKSKFKINKIAVTETVKGTNFGPYSAKYSFNKAENKWYRVDFEGNKSIPNDEYTKTLTIAASTYPTLYGFAGEGGGQSYFAVFTDGNHAYMIELPAVIEEEEPGALEVQKNSMGDILATLRFER